MFKKIRGHQNAEGVAESHTQPHCEVGITCPSKASGEIPGPCLAQSGRVTAQKTGFQRLVNVSFLAPCTGQAGSVSRRLIPQFQE